MSGTSSDVMSPENLVNQALDKIGYPQSIASLYEGSRAAQVAVRIYSQTRDELLRAGDFPFARQRYVLTLLKTAPPGGYGATGWTTAYPPVPWVYEYAYPTNALDVRSVRPVPTIIPDNNPFYSRFVVTTDPTVTPQKVIVTNLGPSAQAVITAQIVDPTQWEAVFVDQFIDALAMELQQALDPDVAQTQLKSAEAQRAAAAGETRRG
jgi:hypothetical protein